MLGFPAFPITPTNPLFPGFGLMPLPTRYRIYFGEPIDFEGNANDEDDVILEKVGVVKRAMEKLIERGLDQREHVFW